MATLCLDAELDHCAWRDLHDWLGGAGAVLLSNPEDFQPLGRYKESLKMRGLRALTVKRDAGSLPAIAPAQSTWVDDPREHPQTVWLREPPFAAADPVSFAARTLRGELLTARARFVMFIDGSLKRRAMLNYGGGTLAAADLLAAADALRDHGVARAHRVIGKAA